jgi:hypothetical protein
MGSILRGRSYHEPRTGRVIDVAETSSAPHKFSPSLSRAVKWSFPHEIPKMENKAESLMYAVDDVGDQKKSV